MSNSSLSELSNLSSLFEECQGSYDSLGKEIVENLSLYGLGVMPKSDIEGLFFHCICNVIEKKYYDAEVLNSENFYELNNNYVKDLDYVLMKLLKISPSKLRSLRVTRSAKFLNNFDYEHEENQKRLVALLNSVVPLTKEELKKDRIQISVSDPHDQALIERFMEDNKSIVDHSINPKLLVLNTRELLSFAVLISKNDFEEGDDYKKLIEKLNDHAEDDNKKIEIGTPVKQLAKRIKDISIDTAIEIMTEKLIPILGNLIISNLP